MIEDLKLNVELKKFNLNNRTELYGESSLQVADALLDLAIAIQEDSIIDGIFQKRDEKYVQYLEKALQIFRKNIDSNDIKIQRTLYYLSMQGGSEMGVKYLEEAHATAENSDKPNMLPLIFIEYAMTEKQEKKHPNSDSIYIKHANEIILKSDDIEDLSALSVFELMSYYEIKGMVFFRLNYNDQRRKIGLDNLEAALDLAKKYGTNRVSYGVKLQNIAILGRHITNETMEVRRKKVEKYKLYLEKVVEIFENNLSEKLKPHLISAIIYLSEIEQRLNNTALQKKNIEKAYLLAKTIYRHNDKELRDLEFRLKLSNVTSFPKKVFYTMKIYLLRKPLLSKLLIIFLFMFIAFLSSKLLSTARFH